MNAFQEPPMKPFQYQLNAIKFCLDKRRAYLAADMGVGKTMITLKVIEELKLPALVFGPLKTIVNTWPAEIRKWTPNLSYCVLHGANKTLLGTEKFDILLINYDGLKWLSKQTGNWVKRIVVFDESSMIKSHSTERFKLLLKMRPLWLTYMFMLSGTPAPQSLMDLWSQYKLLDGGIALGATISSFRQEYCRVVSYPGVPVPIYSVAPEKAPVIMTKIAPMTYRLKAEDYLDLPEYVYNNIECPLPAAVMARYREFEKEFVLEVGDQNIEAGSSAVLGIKLRQFIQGCIYDADRNVHEIHTEKLARMSEIVKAATSPILCAIQFKNEAQMLLREFPKTPRITGGAKEGLVSEYILDWNRGKIPLLICHPASMAHGMNLQFGGHTLLWYCLTWNLEHYLQFNARLRRIGQTEAVFVNHLVVPGTVDEHVAKALQRKESVMSSLLEFFRNYKHF
jgi:SNF2 family DNA or RNA helicase